jgi:predicted ATPase
MRIKSVLARNFLSFGRNAERINFDDRTIIVGPNNAGKTNIFRAINFVGNIFANRTEEFASYYHNADPDHPFEVSIAVSLDEEEVEAFTDFMICSSIMAGFNPESGEQRDALDILQKEVSLRHGKEFFGPLFTDISLEVRGQAQSNYPFRNFVRLAAPDGRELFVHSYGLVTNNPVNPQNYIPFHFPQLLIDDLRLRSPESTREYLTKQTNAIPQFNGAPQNVFDMTFSRLTEREQAVGINIPGFIFRESEYKLAGVREMLRLRAFLGRRSFVGDQVNFFTLITTIYNSSLIITANIRSKPRAFLTTQETSESTAAPITILTGEELPAVLFRLKNSAFPTERRKYSQILDVFRQITDGLEFDVGIRARRISTSPTNELTFIEGHQMGARTDMGGLGISLPENTRLLGVRTKEGETIQYELVIQIVRNNQLFPLDFAAAGIFESLVLLTALIGHEHKVILLDEPALNLHPVMQKRIQELIKKASDASNQVIVITHSPYLVDVDTLHHMWRFFNAEDETRIINMGETLKVTSEEDAKRIVQQLRSSEVRSLLFSSGAVLVEGPSDRIVIEKVDRHLSLNGKGANIEGNEWTVIDIGSKDNLTTFIRLASKLQIPYVCVMDNDALMRCEKTITMDNSKVVTSAIPFHLHSVGALTQSDLQELAKFSGSIEDHNGQKHYKQEVRKALSELAGRYDIFVFTTDLELILQNPVGMRDSKPRRALDEILRRISEGNIPQEIYDMTEFIKKTIQAPKRSSTHLQE